MNDKILTFPCHFPIKIVGKHSDGFVEDVVKLTKKHFPTFSEDTVKYQHSKEKAYVSLTITVYAEDKSTLDALYRALSAHPDSKMVL
ncbi:MAG: DUF493 domain-containing protein [Methylococcales bacterium]|nr:DUF493 domain-containing protein [Methylococcales bacterium]